MAQQRERIKANYYQLANVSEKAMATHSSTLAWKIHPMGGGAW